MSNHSELISTLNGLIETCKDGQEGFQSAAGVMTDVGIRQIFLDASNERAVFVSELQKLVNESGGTPETSGTVAAALHRGWINLKAAVTGKDERAVLEECLRGEDVAVTIYREALDKLLPTSVAAVVQLQYDKILESRDRVRGLKIVTSAVARA
jgi:uncharacterized protein (TIGR02284 family)